MRTRYSNFDQQARPMELQYIILVSVQLLYTSVNELPQTPTEELAAKFSPQAEAMEPPRLKRPSR